MTTIPLNGAGSAEFTRELVTDFLSVDALPEVAQTGALLMVGFTHRFFRANRYLKKLIDSGSIGRVLSMRVRMAHHGPYDSWSARTDGFFRHDMAGGAAVLAREWRPRFGLDAGERVGVLLPNMNIQPVVLLSLWAAQKVPAMINFSTGIPVMLQCAQLADLKHIITSRQFLGKARLNLTLLAEAGIVIHHLEDIRPRISRFAKFAALVKAGNVTVE